MWIKSLMGRLVVVSSALVVGLALGLLGLNSAHASTQSTEHSRHSPITSIVVPGGPAPLMTSVLAALVPGGPAPAFPRNASGQTYGSDLYATSLATEPDLVLAQCVGGSTGYVRAVDLNGKMPKTPQEAVAMDSLGPRSIPCYASNGKTIIGTFIIGGASQGYSANIPQPTK